MVFSRVTLFSFHSNQSDAVQSGGAFTSANMCFPEDVLVIVGNSNLYAIDPLQICRRDGCRRANSGSGWQDGRCRSLRCEMYPHRRVVGALFLTISASRGGQMYHTDVFSLSGCGSVLYSHPKAILSGRGIIGGRHGRQRYPDILSMDILSGQPEAIMHVSIKAAGFHDGGMWLQLSDGRILGIPLAYMPALANASPEQLENFELSPRGIHWDELDEDLSLGGLLVTQPLQRVRSRSVKKA
ncbi:MAG: DUF2442 domain-containing protein [Corynebacterium sp.]|nr:DUF2442 domain-containing protein [Corynebacterium sp.]